MSARPASLVAGVGCLLAASCGGRALAPAGAVFTDGSRLKAIWEQAPGAPKRQTGWYDTALETSCEFGYATAYGMRHALAETQYCMPATVFDFEADAFTGRGLFSDAACTLPVVGARCVPRFARMFPVAINDCGQSMRLFRTGASVAAADLFEGDGAGGCARAGRSPEDGLGWYGLGEEIPLATLVSATIEIPAGDGSRVRPTKLHASDGARQPVGAWDTERAEAVWNPTWAYGEEAGAKWEPDSRAFRDLNPTWYSDAACSISVAVGIGCGGEPVRSISEPATPTCGHRTLSRYYETGAQLDESAIYFYPSGSCAPLTPEQLAPGLEYRFFPLGPPIPDSALADATEIDLGTDRIRIRVLGSPDGPVDTGIGEHFDRQLQQTCMPMTAADGLLRCLPTSELYFGDLFADAACTNPLVTREMPAAGCDAAPPPGFASIRQSPWDVCGGQLRYRAYRTSGLHVGAVYFRYGAACIDLTGNIGTVDVFELGAEMPPDAFAPIATSDHYPGW